MVDFGRRPGDMFQADYDTDASGVVDTVETLPVHVDDHETLGDDELSVEGLSGELADLQPPEAHLLGSATHSADTLAHVNALISDGTLDKTTDPRTPAAHKASHQDGGTDEISVSALSGELADVQPPKTHDLAGADHNADTLADLNLKVSDATLDDSAAARTPAAHKASHQDGGTDEIDATGLAGRTNYVDRGDPSAYDWEHGVLTTDGTWNDLDCSSIVPAGATLIHFTLGIRDDAVGSYFQMRKNGNTNGYNIESLTVQVAAQTINGGFLVSCDSSRIIEYIASNVAFSSIFILVRGWFI